MNSKIGWITLIFLFGGCYYDVEEVLYPNQVCDTTDIRYQKDIVPILDNNCYVCHSAAANLGNITLQGYENIINHVQSGKLSGAINHESGFSPMPQNAPKLPECQILKIEKWISEGGLNN